MDRSCRRAYRLRAPNTTPSKSANDKQMAGGGRDSPWLVGRRSGGKGSRKPCLATGLEGDRSGSIPGRRRCLRCCQWDFERERERENAAASRTVDPAETAERGAPGAENHKPGGQTAIGCLATGTLVRCSHFMLGGGAVLGVMTNCAAGLCVHRGRNFSFFKSHHVGQARSFL